MRRLRSLPAAALSCLLCATCIVPFLLVLLMSLRSSDGTLTLSHYYQVLLGQSSYLVRFWKSVGLSALIALGQLVLSALAAFGFAKYSFRGKHALFFALIVLMILPVQVTLIPNYIVLDRLSLLNSYASLILPAIILPLGTFLLTHSFRSIPNNVIEAARLDGCRLPTLLVHVVLPMSRNAIVSTFLLSFLDAWNMVEQPITYLQRFTDYPLAVALATVSPTDPSVMLSACVLVTLPPLLLFALFNRELTEGIARGGES